MSSMSVPVFKVLDWVSRYHVIVECDKQRDRVNPGLIGETVLINDRRMRVKGFEVYLLGPDCPIRAGEKIGLLFEEAPVDELDLEKSK